MILNTSEAALHLGYKSRTTLQRLLRDGLLEQYKAPRVGRELLLETNPPGLPSLRERIQALTQVRPSSPLWRLPTTEEPVEARDEGSDWEGIAERLNAYLGDRWPAPPYSGDQVNTLAMCLSLAGDYLYIERSKQIKA
jgi:hypothetical protein